MKKRRSKNIKADYQAKDLKNPFFYRTKDRAGGFWILLLILLVAIGLTWFLFFSSFFMIKNVEISGLDRVDDFEIRSIVNEQLEQKKIFFFSQRNIFIFNKDTLNAEVLETYNFSEILINKRLPKTLKIELRERPYAFIFQNGQDYYYASKDAYIIKDEEVSDEDKAKYFILENKSEMIKIGANLKINLKNDYLDFIFKLNEALSYQNDIKVDRYIIEQELNSLVVDFVDGPLVYFNLNRDPLEQFENLTIVKKEKMRDNFNTVNYIDMRYGDLIYIN